MQAPVPDKLARFRETCDRVEYGPVYNGWAQFGWSNLVGLAAVVFALTQLESVTALEWLTLPGAFLIANVVEHWLHRNPMHRPFKGLYLLYQRHTLTHHAFFPHTHMPVATSRQFKMVLFPVWAVVALSVLVGPIAAVFALVSVNAAWLFVVVAMGYFVLYEWLHLAYHLDPEGVVGRLPGMAALRRHHTLHHDPRLMGRYNFNVTFPIADWLFGTLYAEDPVADVPAGHEASG